MLRPDPLPPPFLEGDENRRTMEDVDDAGRDNPDNPRMPFPGSEDDALSSREPRLPLDLFQHVAEHLLFQRLAFRIAGIEPVGDCGCLLPVAAE